MISPVWLQVRHKGNKEYEITGTHDIDTKWVEDVRRAGPRGQKSKINSVPIWLFYLINVGFLFSFTTSHV